MKPDPDYAEFYSKWSEGYDDFYYGRSLSSIFMRKSHALAERAFDASTYFSRVVEVGAGSGQHLSFVRHKFDTYVMTDVRTEMLERSLARHPEELRRKVEIEKIDATRLSFEDAQFDRLIATHVLEHLYYPHRVLREWHRVVKPGGVVSIVLPCDPGMLWRLGRMLGPRAKSERAGIAYDYWMAREHVNPIHNLVALIEYYFEDFEAIWYPTRLPSMDLNLFYICNIKRH